MTHNDLFRIEKYHTTKDGSAGAYVTADRTQRFHRWLTMANGNRSPLFPVQVVSLCRILCLVLAILRIYRVTLMYSALLSIRKKQNKTVG